MASGRARALAVGMAFLIALPLVACSVGSGESATTTTTTASTESPPRPATKANELDLEIIVSVDGSDLVLQAACRDPAGTTILTAATGEQIELAAAADAIQVTGGPRGLNLTSREVISVPIGGGMGHRSTIPSARKPTHVVIFFGRDVTPRLPGC